MNKEKQLLLDETYRLFMNQGMGISEKEQDILTAIADEKLMGFGTTIDEKILSVDQFLELLEIQKEQSKGLVLRWEIKPISHYTSADENTAIFADDLFLYVGVGSEMVEMYLRFSVILVYQQNKWMVIHWHGSKPENVESEKDTFGIENWKQKAEALEKLVDERTADLVLKNRELEIEASLERVRSRTMAMHKPKELQEVIHTVHKELLNLGLSIHGGSFIVINSDIDTELRCWGSGGTANTSEEVHIPRFEKPFYTRLVNGIKNGPGFFSEEYTAEEKKEFFNFLFAHKPWSDLNSDAKNETLLSECGYTRSCEVSTYTSIFIINQFGEKFSDADNDILQRFGKVFEQTYTRFLDLQKAEAHAVQAELDLIAIKEARQKAEAALTELQVTQKQLIQSEKMASLGELTAGIAHEIQNPLNFVNNFSEVSNELIDEMNAELDKGDIDEAKAIASDVKQNLEKINHHGKRADAIVKGMLQHSRSSSGQKEATDINALADEYLRLAYHGLRAKDKRFNATLKTDYDESIGNINIIPQDMGRVILNLITNAFYAVDEKKKSSAGSAGELTYEPAVSVSIKKINDTVVIKISDNGNGIPANILDKIFQPFFTTKPTGQGTGLGLSLAYDIVKAHGGELKVETILKEGTIFTIQVPFA